MKQSSFVVAALTAMLVGTNAWWAYRTLDSGISFTYLHASHDTASQQAAQALAVLRVLIGPAATRDAVLAAANTASPGSDPYEKLGYTWIGQLGFLFDQQGKLLRVVSSEDEAK